MDAEGETASVLAVAGNYAVVKLPKRNFPAAAIQGDSLKILQGTLQELAENLDAGDLSEARFVAGEVASVISDMLSVYEAASREKGFALPYYGP
ncbi:hypothetical protein AB0P15_33545 [Streptomyces sp. NPDC087917]|uniref:DUF6959 family protein n=1 Tax=Streptomyces sp. NPDC087917 TaxID=3155060 RepID=UPI003421D3B3